MKRVLTFIRAYKGFAFAVAAAIVALGLQVGGLQTAANIILAVAAGISVIKLLAGMVQDLRDGSYGIDILAATAIIVSIVAQEYWTAIVIVLMLTGGESLEDYAEHRAKTELNALLDRAPQKAHVYRKKELVDIAVKLIKVGDLLVVKPGEVVPVDGVITEGVTSLDESSLTGESLPQTKEAGATVLSGAINVDGAITVRATASAEDSQYEQIIKMVRSAASSQAPFVRLADRYAVPFTVVAFIIAFGAWFLSGDSERFLQVLVVATPCPLILAAPIAIISGMSRSAKNGIIIKNGSALEQLAAVKTFAFDKTGTLTRGQLKVSKVTPFAGHSIDGVVAAAAALESNSTHVLAKAITAEAERRKLKFKPAKHTKETAGHGLEAQFEGKPVLVGSLGLMKRHDVAMPKAFKDSDISQTATFVSIDKTLAGMISFEDQIREESPATIKRLEKLGIRNFMMLTGDNKYAAKKIAAKLGITRVTADALPADKLIAVERIDQRPVAFVGDGVNDAPVLTASDVGIALGARGSTAASESANIVVMLDDVSKVADAYAIAKRTFQIARQSIFIGIALSVILMLVYSTGRFSPLSGALVQELVDIVVIIYALRAHVIKV